MKTAVENRDCDALSLAQHDAEEAGVAKGTLHASAVTRKLLVWSAYKDPPGSSKDVKMLHNLVLEAEDADVVQLCWGGQLFKVSKERLEELQKVEDAVDFALAVVPSWQADVTQDKTASHTFQNALKLTTSASVHHWNNVLIKMIPVFEVVASMKEAAHMMDIRKLREVVAQAYMLHGAKLAIPKHKEEFFDCIRCAETFVVNSMLDKVDSAIDLQDLGGCVREFDVRKVLRDAQRRGLCPDEELILRGEEAIDRWEQAVIQGIEDCNRGLSHCAGGDVKALEELIVRAKRLSLSEDIVKGLEGRIFTVVESQVVLEACCMKTATDLEKLNWAIAEADKLHIHKELVNHAKKEIATYLLQQSSYNNDQIDDK